MKWVPNYSESELRGPDGYRCIMFLEVQRQDKGNSGCSENKDRTIDTDWCKG